MKRTLFFYAFITGLLNAVTPAAHASDIFDEEFEHLENTCSPACKSPSVLSLKPDPEDQPLEPSELEQEIKAPPPQLLVYSKNSEKGSSQKHEKNEVESEKTVIIPAPKRRTLSHRSLSGVRKTLEKSPTHRAHDDLGFSIHKPSHFSRQSSVRIDVPESTLSNPQKEQGVQTPYEPEFKLDTQSLYTIDSLSFRFFKGLTQACIVCAPLLFVAPYIEDTLGYQTNHNPWVVAGTAVSSLALLGWNVMHKIQNKFFEKRKQRLQNKTFKAY